MSFLIKDFKKATYCHVDRQRETEEGGSPPIRRRAVVLCGIDKLVSDCFFISKVNSVATVIAKYPKIF
jgi:hypothetical protein